MKIFNIKEFLSMKNPTPDKNFRSFILTDEDSARELGGVFGLLPAGSRGRYHYHEKRETIQIIIGGEGTQIIDGKEFPVKAGDVIFVPAGAKHNTVNSSDKELRYFGFWTHPPAASDFVEVK